MTDQIAASGKIRSSSDGFFAWSCHFFSLAIMVCHFQSCIPPPLPVSLFIKYPVYALDNGQRSVSRPVIVVCVDGDGRGLGGEANVCHWSHGSEQNRYIDDRRCQPLARWYCRILFACLCERKLNSWTRLVRKMEILHTIAYVPR